MKGAWQKVEEFRLLPVIGITSSHGLDRASARNGDRGQLHPADLTPVGRPIEDEERVEVAAGRTRGERQVVDIHDTFARNPGCGGIGEVDRHAVIRHKDIARRIDQPRRDLKLLRDRLRSSPGERQADDRAGVRMAHLRPGLHQHDIGAHWLSGRDRLQALP